MLKYWNMFFIYFAWLMFIKFNIMMNGATYTKLLPRIKTYYVFICAVFVVKKCIEVTWFGFLLNYVKYIMVAFHADTINQ